MSQPSAVAELSCRLSIDCLSQGGELFVSSVRQWVASARQRRCVKRDLIPAYHASACLDALTPFDELMSLIVLAATRSLRVCAPEDTALSDDELTLLRVMRAVARNEGTDARHELSGLITARAAEAFSRIAGEYLSRLGDAGLHCTGVRRLPVVGASR